MEDLKPISAAEQAAFCVEMTKRLNMQRKQDHLCDVTLVTKDDKEFKAHRNVLSAASPFFHKLLQSDMKENREGIARFEEISGSVMEDVLEFIYTGSVEITQENSEYLIATANYLIIPGLKTVSGRFLEGQMTKSNCISTFYFAEKYQCDELIANSRKFIHANFASVAEMDEFLNLEAKEVERWISNDEISVPDEADVFRIILKWVEQDTSNRKSVFEELFRHVQLVFLSRDYLFDVVTNELVRENSVCLKLTLDAMKLTSFTSENEFSQSPRKGIETRAIVACGGKYTFCYLPEKDEWKRLPDGLLENRSCYTQMINFRDQLYTFHGCKAERYDPVFDVWSTLKSAPRGDNVTVVRGEIYAIEVDTYSKKKSTIARYDVERCSWQTVLQSHEGCRQDACVVAAGNHLYVLGGTPPQTRECVAKAERFDTVEYKWEEIVDMQQARGGAFGVATQGKIFVAGGRDRENCMSQTCEMYNISSNEWQFIGSLNVSRVCGSMVCLKGTLYVLGGTRDNWSRSDLSVECYDPTEDKWIKKTTIPVKTISEENKDTFTGCALKLSKGVLDKAYVVKLNE
ncbi:kelch-like protein 24 [Oculina patagonica]